MADIVDIANDYLERALEDSLLQRVRYAGESADECEECGVLIPLGRRVAVPGCRLCVYCQEEEDERYLR